MLKRPMKKGKGAHTANTQVVSGDFYGTGIKNPLGKVKAENSRAPMPATKLKTKPKSLA